MPVTEEFPVCLLVLLEQTPVLEIVLANYRRVPEIAFREAAIPESAMVEYDNAFKQSPVEVAELYICILKCARLDVCIAEVASGDVSFPESAAQQVCTLETYLSQFAGCKIHSFQRSAGQIFTDKLSAFQFLVQFCDIHRLSELLQQTKITYFLKVTYIQCTYNLTLSNLLAAKSSLLIRKFIIPQS